MTQYLFAVSGLMGSGKTTLARNLAERLGWRSLPVASLGTKFLPDLFRDAKRWAFEAQISFLIDKALQILRHSEAGHPELVGNRHFSGQQL